MPTRWPTDKPDEWYDQQRQNEEDNKQARLQLRQNERENRQGMGIVTATNAMTNFYAKNPHTSAPSPSAFSPTSPKCPSSPSSVPPYSPIKGPSTLSEREERYRSMLEEYEERKGREKGG